MLTEIRKLAVRKTFKHNGVDIWEDAHQYPTADFYPYICPDCGKKEKMELLKDRVYVRCICGREFEKEKVLINY